MEQFYRIALIGSRGINKATSLTRSLDGNYIKINAPKNVLVTRRIKLDPIENVLDDFLMYGRNKRVDGVMIMFDPVDAKSYLQTTEMINLLNVFYFSNDDPTNSSRVTRGERV